MEPTTVLLGGLDVFRSLCIDYLWRRLLSFSASRLYLEDALNELVSVVYVCVGVGLWLGGTRGSDLEIGNEVTLCQLSSW